MLHRIALAIGLFAALVPLPGLLGAVACSAARESTARPSSTREYKTVIGHLRAPFRGYGAVDVLAPQFGIVALSHMASGLLNVATTEPSLRGEVSAALDEVVRRALSSAVSPFHAATTATTPFDDHNLFWSHLGLILGIARYVRCGARPCETVTDGDRVQDRIVGHLRARSLASAAGVAPSYPGSPQWPADEAVTLLALKMHDAVSGGSLHEEPLRLYLRALRRRADPQTGLFPAAISGVMGGNVPRGCATSWTILYLAQLDPDAAREQYVRAREALGVSILGVGGFREWPVGRGGGQDVDSGPIVLGVGTAATGLGLGPARLFRDQRTYSLIRRAALAFGVPAWWPSGGYLTAPLLAEAILFDGRTATPWFGALAPVEPRPAPFPVGPVLLAALDLLFVGGACRALLRSIGP